MIRDYFYRAQENKPSILFIDEIDGIVGSRDRGSEYNSELVSEFLKQMDGMRSSTDVMIVGATNRPFDLDPAILRPGRFDKLVYIGPPNAGDRKRMFIRFLKNAPISTLDFDKLADMTDGFTGADIDGVCNEAKRRMMNSAVDSKETPDITQELLEEIIGHVSPSAPEELLDDYTKFRKRYGGRE
jgi:ATPases of the AAA+ class